MRVPIHKPDMEYSFNTGGDLPKGGTAWRKVKRRQVFRLDSGYDALESAARIARGESTY